MFAKICLASLVLFSFVFAAPTANAFDPYGYQFGYSMGYQNSFRNRLPTPPYFSIYSPVYYGKRFERPYGDSPYASFSQLRSSHDYHPVPKEVPFRTRSIVNSFVEPNSHEHHGPSVKKNGASSIGEPVAEATTRVGKQVVIINPYAQPQATASK
jgi:hypothetical protein